MTLTHPSVTAAPLVVSLLTPPGRGALAVVGLAGESAAPTVDSLLVPSAGPPVSSRADGSICFGRWTGRSGGAGEDVVVVRRGPGLIEVHCHGGLAAPEAVIESLVAAGAGRLSWSEWLRAVEPDAIAAEARELLPLAGGPKAASILARQLAGRLHETLCRIEGLTCPAEVSAAVDRLLRAARVGMRLATPWRVVLAGDVNAGKSSLLNVLAGYARSIVSELPGTTRDLVEVRLVIEGWEMHLIDTAGLRDPDTACSAVEREGIARAVAARRSADLVVWVRPADAAPFAGPTRPGELVALSKTDLGMPTGRLPADAIPTSAVTGVGVAELAGRIAAALVPEERDEPTLLSGAVPFTARQVAMLTLLRDAAGGRPRAEAGAQALPPRPRTTGPAG